MSFTGKYETSVMNSNVLGVWGNHERLNFLREFIGVSSKVYIGFINLQLAHESEEVVTVWITFSMQEGKSNDKMQEWKDIHGFSI